MTRSPNWSALVLLAVLIACSSSPNPYRGLDADALFARAVAEAENRKWDNAVEAFEQFMFNFPTHAKVQEARYRLGEVYFNKKDYILAATEFARLADDFPTGEYGDDARFRVCESYARLSPRPQLDQEYSRSAIGHCRYLVASYPESEYAARADSIMRVMTNKLAEKAHQAGELYMRQNAIDSAILTFTNLLGQYPDAAIVPRTLLRLYKAYEKIGYNEEARETRDRLLKDFPDSPEAREIKGSAAESDR
jgi:outer membrane protein assembly factor BamD